MYYKKCNPKCNGVMVIRFRYVYPVFPKHFFRLYLPPLPPPPDISPASFISSPKPLMKLYKPRALTWDFTVVLN